jgi:hypothetical protein
VHGLPFVVQKQSSDNKIMVWRRSFFSIEARGHFWSLALPKGSVTKYFHFENENDSIMVRKQISTLEFHKKFAILQIGHLFLSIFRFGKILLVKKIFSEFKLTVFS